jgi:hypothetical protein
MAQWNKDAQAYRAQDTTNFEVVMIADEDGNPINSFGAASNIPIAGGQIEGYNYVHKFGANTDLANGDYEAIWDGNAAYPWTTLDSPATALTTNIAALNNGAEVTIQGLNENWELTTEVLTLDGTAQTTQNSYKRVFRAFCSGSQALGADFTLSKAAVVVLKIQVAHQQTLMSVYTVPAGKSAYLFNLNVSTLKNEEITVRVSFRLDGKVFRTQHIAQVASINYDHTFTVPLYMPEKTDVQLEALAGSSGVAAYAHFDLILVDN